MSLLPADFSALERHVEHWVLPDSSCRHAKRLSTDYAEIKRFYDDMLQHAPAALALLSQRKLGELDDPEQRLLKLLLALAEVGPAVEWYQGPEVVDGFAAERFVLTRQLSDTAAQEV